MWLLYKVKNKYFEVKTNRFCSLYQQIVLQYHQRDFLGKGRFFYGSNQRSGTGYQNQLGHQ